MQPYRTAKPHAPAQCPLCGPTGRGHPLCQHDGCSQLAAVQVQRHATLAEYQATPEHLTPTDGIMHRTAYGCDDHGENLEPFCQHSAPPPVACPKCKATGSAPCVTSTGRKLSRHHLARIEAQPPAPEPCRHVHREDCPIFSGCVCSQHDQPPARTPRVVPTPPPPGPAPIVLPTHGPTRDVLTAHGVDIERVIANELVPKGDGSNVMVLTTTMVVRQANGDLSYDEHGKPRTETAQIQLALPRPTDPVDLRPAL